MSLQPQRIPVSIAFMLRRCGSLFARTLAHHCSSLYRCHLPARCCGGRGGTGTIGGTRPASSASRGGRAAAEVATDDESDMDAEADAWIRALEEALLDNRGSDESDSDEAAVQPAADSASRAEDTQRQQYLRQLAQNGRPGEIRTVSQTLANIASETQVDDPSLSNFPADRDDEALSNLLLRRDIGGAGAELVPVGPARPDSDHLFLNTLLEQWLREVRPSLEALHFVRSSECSSPRPNTISLVLRTGAVGAVGLSADHLEWVHWDTPTTSGRVVTLDKYSRVIYVPPTLKRNFAGDFANGEATFVIANTTVGMIKAKAGDRQQMPLA